jgi:Zn-finger protein
VISLEVSNLKFIANVDGSITCEIYDSLGEKQDLTGCYIKFNLTYTGDDNAIISEEMTVLDTGDCVINLKPEDTAMLGNEEYEFNLIIIDNGNKKHATEKVKVSVYRPIE